MFSIDFDSWKKWIFFRNFLEFYKKYEIFKSVMTIIFEFIYYVKLREIISRLICKHLFNE